MSYTSDKKYGRGGGRFVAAEAPKKPDPVHQPEPPTPVALAKHLISEHRLSSWVVAEHTPIEHLAWHAAEHKHCQEILTHHHKTGAQATVAAGDEMAGYLRQAKDGKLPAPKIDEFVARAEMAGRRRSEGHPLSPYDRQCMEIAAAVAARAARKAKRRAA